MEHIIFSFIMNHSSTNNIISSCQHGFRPGHSCITQLLPFIEDILHAMDQHFQVDILLLDFSKAFDTVPHKRLLSKLSYFGINGPLLEWIRNWLTQRTQKVILNGEASKEVKVISGVPQATVLGPLMFLLYVNDIYDNTSSSIRMFADDCVLYRIIQTPSDHHYLQNDLDTIILWANQWQMNLNANKSVVLHCTRSQSPNLSDYFMDSKPLPTHEQHQYLGLTIHQSLSWSNHIHNITSKASRTLNFIRRNLSKCSIEVKESAYLTLVRPCLEYAACVWDPHQLYLKKEIEKVQRRAVRWTLSDYSRYNSVTEMLSQLQWATLEQRRYITRLSIFYKILYDHDFPVQIPPYFLTTQYPTRQYHTNHFILPSGNTTQYQLSYFPRTIKDWNTLPLATIESPSLTTFVCSLKTLLD